MFPRNGFTVKTFQLDQPGDSIRLTHSGTRSGGPAYFQVFGDASAGFREDGNFFGDLWYVARLSADENISAGPFYSNSSAIGTAVRGLMAYGDSGGRWTEPGIGYIGFKFNSGAGVQYGWIRVRMGGSDNKNAFRVLGYAYADPGEPITAGQRPHGEQSPDQGSLGWLALGAVGLLTWRKNRLRAARQTRLPLPV